MTRAATRDSQRPTSMLQMNIFTKTSSQAPSYASSKLRPTDLLTGVKCRATSVAKNNSYNGLT